eukprot:350040-Chlamydomonas_euryale.AAC.2
MGSDRNQAWDLSQLEHHGVGCRPTGTRQGARSATHRTSSRGGPFSPLHHWLTSSSLLTAWSQAAASCSAALCASRTRDLAQSSEPRST